MYIYIYTPSFQKIKGAISNLQYLQNQTTYKERLFQFFNNFKSKHKKKG